MDLYLVLYRANGPHLFQDLTSRVFKIAFSCCSFSYVIFFFSYFLFSPFLIALLFYLIIINVLLIFVCLSDESYAITEFLKGCFLIHYLSHNTWFVLPLSDTKPGEKIPLISMFRADSSVNIIISQSLFLMTYLLHDSWFVLWPCETRGR